MSVRAKDAKMRSCSPLDRVVLLWHDLCAVQDVVRQRVLVLLRNELDAKLVLGTGAGLDGIRKVTTQIVGVLAAEFERLVPDKTVDAEMRLPVELDKGLLALLVDEGECVLRG